LAWKVARKKDMKKILIQEVGLRDGLQAEEEVVPLEQKIHWVEGLLGSGIDILQLGSFVHPGKVPQMADTDRLFAHFLQDGKRPGATIFSGLVLNERGLERGLECGVELFAMGVSASETHSVKNTGMSTADALDRIIAMGQRAETAGKRVQVSVQSAFGCGFEGAISEAKVLGMVRRYLDAGLRRICLADTAGHAHPLQVEELFGAIRQLDPSVELACHFHNTYGLGLANCYAALKSGVISFDSALGGLGGCPFTKIPAGNVSTEDLVHSFQRMGLRQDIHLDQILAVARDLGRYFQRELPGYILKSGSLASPGTKTAPGGSS
jgi:hydroxymethylglutaryl-CoA lyase